VERPHEIMQAGDLIQRLAGRASGNDPRSTLAEVVASPTRRHCPRRSPHALFFILDNGFALCERGSAINSGGYSAEALEENSALKANNNYMEAKRNVAKPSVRFF
jgi:hypothetical protein